MTPRARAGLVAAAASLAALLAVLAVVVAAGRDSSDDAASPTGSAAPSSTSSGTATTLELRPVGPPAAPSTSEGPVATVAPADPVVSPAGAVLRRPATLRTRTTDEEQGCAGLGDGPDYAVECDTVDAGEVTLVWLTERHRRTGGLRAYVFRQLDGSQHALALAMIDDGPDGAQTYDSVTVRTADVSGAGGHELVFGFRLLGSGSILAVDLVESPGRVAGHLDLEKGAGRVSPGQLDVWAAEFGPTEANCCPSTYRHDVIAYRAGEWRVVLSESVAAGDVPPSEL